MGSHAGVESRCRCEVSKCFHIEDLLTNGQKGIYRTIRAGDIDHRVVKIRRNINPATRRLVKIQIIVIGDPNVMVNRAQYNLHRLSLDKTRYIEPFGQGLSRRPSLHEAGKILQCRSGLIEGFFLGL